mgnify:CR=1 FL=1
MSSRVYFHSLYKTRDYSYCSYLESPTIHFRFKGVDYRTLTFRRRLLESKPALSAKAFLATEQRFPGIGNGVLQDILYEAGIHPKRKVSTLSDEDTDRLEQSVVSTLREMIRLGGRDTEKDLFDQSGGYVTAMSKNTVGTACRRCGSVIVKESYMGGSVYYCPGCQVVVD